MHGNASIILFHVYVRWDPSTSLGMTQSTMIALSFLLAMTKLIYMILP